MIDHDLLARHDRIGLFTSGGKDSLACVYLLKDYLPRITCYHVDTGDLLPEMRESVNRVEGMAPNFVRIETHVADWIAEHGLPSDLVPHTSHWLGGAMGEPQKTILVPRYDCCFQNLMWPAWERAHADGVTLIIRGTKQADMKRLPAESGHVVEGIELYFPLLNWSHADVFQYLEAEGAWLPKVYSAMTNSPECARCSAWWGEGRAAYLRAHHPELWRDYEARLHLVAEEIALPLAMLRRELGKGADGDV